MLVSCVYEHEVSIGLLQTLVDVRVTPIQLSFLCASSLMNRTTRPTSIFTRSFFSWYRGWWTYFCLQPSWSIMKPPCINMRTTTLRSQREYVPASQEFGVSHEMEASLFPTNTWFAPLRSWPWMLLRARNLRGSCWQLKPHVKLASTANNKSD